MKQSTLNKYATYFKQLQKEDKLSKKNKNKEGNVNQAEEEAKKVLRQLRDIITDAGYYSK